ncbi:DUF4020 domain-containing protein [Candidatus Sumerlaeota bacterium]|nr:DUF4020 domain-containing protein [Candidatus Sumerlaeota bacterium]
MRDGNLTVFAGAGVSMGEPSNLPSFRELAEQLGHGTGERIQGQEQGSEREPIDRYLGRLCDRNVEVHKRAAELLSGADLKCNRLHRDLLRLFSGGKPIRVVTTNFDLLFEQAAQDVSATVPDIFRAPALPLGRDFAGIVHVHGSVERPEDTVLTDRDFGRAYLTDGWAVRFLLEVFQHYPVLFVGYSCDDTVMQYLTRALPVEGDSPRFALAPENDEKDRWDSLGIIPSLYPSVQKGDHSALYEGVGRLADYVCRGALEWKHVLHELASKPPPTDQEAEDQIRDALEAPAWRRFFLEKARLPEWLTWLDEHKYLEALFQNNDLSDRDRDLAQWLARHYAVRFTDRLLLLIGTYGMRLNGAFWRALAWEVGRDNNPGVDGPALSRWVSVLISTAPRQGNGDDLYELAKRAHELGAVQALLCVFERMILCFLNVQEALFLFDKEETEAAPRITAEVGLGADHWAIKEAWERFLRPILPQVARPLLSLTLSRMEEEHCLLCMAQRADRNSTQWSQFRSAIEPHPQDNYPHASDVIIDVARDCLEHLVSTSPNEAALWCDRHVNADVPLLRRLAVHIFATRTDLAPTQKTDWLLEHCDLYDVAIHHEVFRAMRGLFPETDEETRGRVVERVLSFEWPHEDATDREERTARLHFSWLHWLHESAPESESTKAALDDVLARHPQFLPSKYPDLTSWTEGGFVPYESPWSVEDLLTKPASEWLPDFLAYPGDDFGDYEGAILVVGEAAKRDREWGFALAGALRAGDHWDDWPWTGLLRAWREVELPTEAVPGISVHLEEPRLQLTHPHGAASVLLAIAKNERRAGRSEHFSRLNRIAIDLWNRLDRNESSEEPDDWLNAAINQPAGILAEFWIESLALSLTRHRTMPRTMDEEFARVFTAMTDDPSLHACFSTAVLAGQLPWLLAVDRAWTHEHLLPLFSATEGNKKYRPAWHGFLLRDGVNPAIAAALEEPFLEATAHLDSDLKAQRGRFARVYAYLVGYFIDDPLQRWIPALLKGGDRETRDAFAHTIDGLLQQDLDARQQREWWDRWLRQYWHNRIYGIPALLLPSERDIMFGWLSRFSELFPDAVELATRMPTQPPVEHLRVIYDLGKEAEEGEGEREKRSLVRQYPESIARLMVYLGKPGFCPDYCWSGLKNIMSRLNESKLDPDLVRRLEDTVARIPDVR